MSEYGWKSGDSFLMTNIGETLRTAREEQGLSLNDVVAVTRIRSHFLDALEQNNFEALGGDVYVRGFLRNYATFLGLDPDPLLAPFRSQEHKLPVYKPRSQPRYLAEPLQSNPLPIARIFTMLLALVLLGLIGFSLWVRPLSFDSVLAFLPIQSESSDPATIAIEPIATEESENSEDSEDVASEEPTVTAESEEAEVEAEAEAEVEANPTEESESAVAEAEATETSSTEDSSVDESPTTLNPSPTTVEEVATAVPTASLPPRTSTPEATDATATATETAEPTAVPAETAEPTAVPAETAEPTAVPADEGVVIQAQILSDTWLRVFVDNESGEAVQRTAAPGETFEWIGQESVNIRAGNGSALNLLVNGEEYGLAGGSGQVVDLRWEHDPAGGAPVIVQQ